MPDKICECEQRVDHSRVIDTRFVWLKRAEVYEKKRRRECFVCGLKFNTVEIDKRLMHYYEDGGGIKCQKMD
jgi:transcriptional regulator NrdR family protein